MILPDGSAVRTYRPTKTTPRKVLFCLASTSANDSATWLASPGRAVDLDSGEIAFTTRKTGRRIVLPLVRPLIDYLSGLPANDNPNAYIFPNAATHKRTNSLSNQFREIMADAGLVKPRGHEKAKQGRSQAREPSEISFHSLRHSAVTMLKAAGVSDFIAREIVGHESAAVSRQYTHLTTDDKRAAMQRLPDVTSA